VDKLTTLYTSRVGTARHAFDVCAGYYISAIPKPFQNANDYEVNTVRKKKRKRHFDESTTASEEVELDGKDNFRVNTFNVILDTLRSELHRRSYAYNAFTDRFAVFTKLPILHASDIKSHARALREQYPNDLEAAFENECVPLTDRSEILHN
jgi:hypothetical protein